VVGGRPDTGPSTDPREATVTEIVLFHHAQGLTPGLVALADRWRAGGHVVHTPDVYEGRPFATLAAGLAHAESGGFPELIDSADPSVELFVYPGDQHLFVDSSLPDFDPAAAALFGERVEAFLAAPD